MTRYLRKVIKITALDSPNVQLALRQQSAGLPITGEEVISGLLTWDEYQERLKMWNEMERMIGLDAEFYEGAEIKLFTTNWLDHAVALAGGYKTGGKPAFNSRNYLGVDPAEGGDMTAWAVVSSTQGLIELISKRTADTADIPGETAAIMKDFRIDDNDCAFDRGGGGKIHADIMRRRGKNVRTVAFGDPPFTDPVRGMKPFTEKVDIHEDRYAFRNLRAQMYFELSLDVNFAMPARLLNRNRINGTHSLRFQLSRMPRLLDEDGCYWLPSKGNITEEMKKRNIKTLREIIGCSPDEADAIVIAHHIMKNPQTRRKAGAA